MFVGRIVLCPRTTTNPAAAGRGGAADIQAMSRRLRAADELVTSSITISTGRTGRPATRRKSRDRGIVTDAHTHTRQLELRALTQAVWL